MEANPASLIRSHLKLIAMYRTWEVGAAADSTTADSATSKHPTRRHSLRIGIDHGGV